jgi:DNA polymerase-3 subunit gamma/tau
MSYTVLARRYRSNTFDEVIGQESVSKTLLNAIAQGRVAHAYLFTGTRGVGKTTTARLFARALNAPDTIPGCPKPGLISTDEGKKKKGKAKTSNEANEYPPLDVQERMAAAIMAGQDLNVVEIDGASNNGVEQARQLIANAGLAPTGNALYKIYIIDEVHMLSQAAFNALLKTMEEPPSHVKFILCTTESHKVPATIQSRCQRFDFRNIPTAKIADHLKAVLKLEKVEGNADVIWQLARLGNGSMRDSLSLLDRLIATGESPLTPQVLEQMLGLPAPELVINLVDALADGDIGESLRRTAALLDKGISEDQVVDVLIDRLRQLMLITACGEGSELVELSDEARPLAAAQAARFDAAGLVHMIALCENLQRAGKNSSNPRALLDATMVRLALSEKMADVAALLSSSGNADLKKKVAPPQFPSPRPPAANPPTLALATAPPPPQAPSRQPPRDSPLIAPDPAPQRTVPAAPLPVTIAEASPFLSDDVDEPLPASAGPALIPSSPAPADIWSTILRSIGDRHSLSWVQSLSLARLDDRTAVVALLPGKRDMHRFVSAERQREQLADLFKKALGRPVRIEVESTGGPQTKGTTQGASHAAQHAPAHSGGAALSTQSIRTEREHALALPLVKEVLAVFEATLVETHLEGKTEPAPAAVLPAIEPASPSAQGLPGLDAMDLPDVDSLLDM